MPDIDPDTAQDCRRILRLALPRGPSRDRPDRARAGLVVVRRGTDLIRVLKSPSGRDIEVSADARFDGDASAKELAAQHGVRWVLSLPETAIATLQDQLGEPQPDTLLSQLLKIYSALRDLAQAGELELWPWGGGWWPVRESVLNVGLDAVCGDGSVAILGIFENGRLSTGLAARRRNDGVDAIWGTDRLQKILGHHSQDWRRDQRFLTLAVERELGPVSIGCFGEASTFDSLRGARPGAWTAALATGDVHISPMPLATLVPVTVDLGRALLSTVDGLLAGDGRAPEGISSLWQTFRRRVNITTPTLLLAPLLFVRQLWLRGELGDSTETNCAIIAPRSGSDSSGPEGGKPQE